jgi:hypothetical protein
MANNQTCLPVTDYFSHLLPPHSLRLPYPLSHPSSVHPLSISLGLSAPVAGLRLRSDLGLDGAGNPIYKSGRKATGKPFKKQGGRATESILRAKNGILSLGWGKG